MDKNISRNPRAPGSFRERKRDLILTNTVKKLMHLGLLLHPITSVRMITLMVQRLMDRKAGSNEFELLDSFNHTEIVMQKATGRQPREFREYKPSMAMMQATNRAKYQSPMITIGKDMAFEGYR